MSNRHIQKNLPLVIALALLGLLSFFIALTNGSLDIGWRKVLGVITGTETGMARDVVLQLRLPRSITAFTVGGLLAIAGGLMQVLLRNPLADPYILGVSGGAACGALLAMLAGISGVLLYGATFCGALAAILLVFGLAHAGGHWTTTRLLLTGVVLAAGWGAVISLILAISPQHNIKGMLFWLMGDLSDGPAAGVPLLILTLGLAAALSISRSLNLLARGERQAAVQGVEIAPLRIGIYLLASVLTATAVTVAGSVGFIGLVAPHMLRLVGARDYRILLPCAALLGGSLLVLADTAARTVIAPAQLPVGVLTALIGVPLFLLLLQQGQRQDYRA